DKTGLAVTSQIASSAMSFPVTTTLTQQTSTPTIAAANGTTLVFWDYADTVGTGTGIACRAFDARGAASPGQLTPVTTESTDVVTATALPSGNSSLPSQTSTS